MALAPLASLFSLSDFFSLSIYISRLPCLVTSDIEKRQGDR
jgi:hypothetical protein